MTQILITQRHNQDQYGQYRDTLESNYLKLFSPFDQHIITIPNTLKDTKSYLDKFQPSHIVLSGGDNIQGDFPPSRKYPREHTEWACLEWAIDNNTPVFGICRGFQFINLFFGGTLCPNIHQIDTDHLPGKTHSINLDSSMGWTTTSVEVNSYHNQGVSRSDLAPMLEILATKGDFVESFFHKNLPIVGIQWHPEREDNISQLNLLMLNYFINKESFWGDKT